jgi:hypothetical protein
MYDGGDSRSQQKLSGSLVLPSKEGDNKLAVKFATVSTVNLLDSVDIKMDKSRRLTLGNRQFVKQLCPRRNFMEPPENIPMPDTKSNIMALEEWIKNHSLGADEMFDCKVERGKMLFKSLETFLLMVEDIIGPERGDDMMTEICSTGGHYTILRYAIQNLWEKNKKSICRGDMGENEFHSFATRRNAGDPVDNGCEVHVDGADGQEVLQSGDDGEDEHVDIGHIDRIVVQGRLCVGAVGHVPDDVQVGHDIQDGSKHEDGDALQWKNILVYSEAEINDTMDDLSQVVCDELEHDDGGGQARGGHGGEGGCIQVHGEPELEDRHHWGQVQEEGLGGDDEGEGRTRSTQLMGMISAELEFEI